MRFDDIFEPTVDHMMTVDVRQNRADRLTCLRSLARAHAKKKPKNHQPVRIRLAAAAPAIRECKAYILKRQHRWALVKQIVLRKKVAERLSEGRQRVSKKLANW